MHTNQVEEIVKLVVEELGRHQTNTRQQSKEETTSKVQEQVVPKVNILENSFVDKKSVVPSNKSNTIIPLYKDKSGGSVNNSSKQQEEKTFFNQVTETMMEDRLNEEIGAYLKYTPARVDVGRTGCRPRTSTLLKFRFDHAAAVDAVYGEVSQEILDELNLFTVYTKVEEKEVYIRRPDLGRRLSDESKQIIKEKCAFAPTVQIIASNGLSASALNENLSDVYLSLQQSLKNLNIQVGTPFYAHEGRVGLMDDVGEVLEPEVVINLIGERPGLVSAESMSAYICYQPRHGTIESDRMVVSNIHKGGIPPIEAGAYLGTVIERVLKHQASGVNLIQKEG